MTIEKCPFCGSRCWKYGECLSRIVCENPKCDYRSGLADGREVIAIHNRLCRAAIVMPKLLAAAEHTANRVDFWNTVDKDHKMSMMLSDASYALRAAIAEAKGEGNE